MVDGLADGQQGHDRQDPPLARRRRRGGGRARRDLRRRAVGPAAAPRPRSRRRPRPPARREYLVRRGPHGRRPARGGRPLVHQAGAHGMAGRPDPAPSRPTAPTLPFTAPRICLSRSITPRRAASFAVFDIDEVKEVRAGLRSHLQRRDDGHGGRGDPGLARRGRRPAPIGRSSPRSRRRCAPRTAPPSGNEVSAIFGALPVHLDDPAARIGFLAREMPGAKAFHQELGPRTLASLALRRAVEPRRGAVPGVLRPRPRQPPAAGGEPRAHERAGTPGAAVLRGARMDAMFPLGPIFDGAALNVSVVSYTDKVCVGFLTCPDVCPPVAAPRRRRAHWRWRGLLEAAADDQDLATTRKERAMDVQERNRRALAAVQERRDDFYEAILGLERAMAAAAGDDAAGWAARATTAALDLRAVLRAPHHRHRGRRAASSTTSPRTSPTWPTGRQAPGRARAAARRGRPARRDPVDGRPTTTVSSGLGPRRSTCSGRMLTHRHRGAELVFDAYNVDVATGD